MFTPFRPDLKSLAQINRKNMTKAERIIWYEVLNKKKTGYRFLRQKPIGNYIVDFYCASLALVVEIDGDSHLDDEDYDAERTQFLEFQGLIVFRYSNTEVFEELDWVRGDLAKALDQRSNCL